MDSQRFQAQALSSGAPDEAALPPRVLGRIGDPTSGPTLIVIGAVHGNEPAGYLALRSLFARLQDSPVELRGSLIGLVGNTTALVNDVRFMDVDLNRLWLPELIESILKGVAESAEAAEARELHREIERVLAGAEGPVYALDIHSTSGPGPAFVLFDDSLANREFALELEVPMVLGIEEELEGTLIDHLTARGVRTAGFEAGQHTDSKSAELAEAAIWVAMRASGILGRSCEADVDKASRRLAAAAAGLPNLFEVRYRHAIKLNSSFQMRPGLRGFQTIAKGEPVADEGGAPVLASESGWLLMPLYQAQGEDGYFVIRPVKTVWLGMSKVLRRLRLERFVHWLPGVERIGAGGREIKVNIRVARWLPLDFFHLLGFRRIAQVDEHVFLRRRDKRVELATVGSPVT